MTRELKRIEHWGTFEVDNFGDLLFPLVLGHHLSRALPRAEVDLVGPIGGTAGMGLDRTVRRAVRHDQRGFWAQAATVDAIVLGGGDLVHATEFVVAAGDRARRVDAWTFAAEASLLAEVRPFVWNGLGIPFDVPEELAPLLRTACRSVDLLTVRDEGSKLRLEKAGVDRDIRVVPDTAVLVDRVLPGRRRAATLDELREAGSLPPPGTPFVAVHASFSAPGMIAELAGALDEVRAGHEGLELVLVGIGPTHGDAATLRALAARLTGSVRTVLDPTLLEVAAILEAAEVVVASSFHAMLVASTLGTRTVGFLQSSHRPAKLTDLSRALDRDAWLVDRPSVVATALAAALAGDGPVDRARVAAMVRAGRAHLDHLTEVLEAAEPRPVDLAERTAAHSHLVDRLGVAAAREQRLREDLQVVDVHLRSARTAARTWEAAFWRLEARATLGEDEPVLDVGTIEATRLEVEPYRWGLVGPLFDPEAAAGLARSFPLDGAEEREGTDGRRSWRYRVRCLLPMDRSTPVRPHALDPRWRQLAADLAGPAYRAALSHATGVDLTPLHLEANLFSYGVGSFQEPHPDLPEKVVTHVLWFNEDWQAGHGGCLRILRSRDPEDVHRELLPSLGWSALFVRSASSWHSVTPVTDAAPMDRRALVVTFHRPGSVSSMWGEAPD